MSYYVSFLIKKNYERRPILKLACDLSDCLPFQIYYKQKIWLLNCVSFLWILKFGIFSDFVFRCISNSWPESLKLWLTIDKRRWKYWINNNLAPLVHLLPPPIFHFVAKTIFICSICSASEWKLWCLIANSPLWFMNRRSHIFVWDYPYLLAIACL